MSQQISTTIMEQALINSVLVKNSNMKGQSSNQYQPSIALLLLSGDNRANKL